MARIQARDIHEKIEQINNKLAEQDQLAIDGSRDENGARIWRVGKLGQAYLDMRGPDLTTTQMFYLLMGYESRVAGEVGTVNSGHWANDRSEVEVSSPMVTFYRGYVADNDRVILYDTAGCWQIPNSADLEVGSYHVFEVRSGSTGEYITGYRQALPFDDVDFSSLEPEDRELAIPQFTSNDRNGIFYPQPDPTFILSHEQEVIFDHIFNLAQYKPEKLLISGPPGTGKTEGAREYAARRGYGVFQISCGQIESPAEWFGSRRVVVDENTDEAITDFDLSAFIQALETPNTLIILDEFNRLHSSLQNSLYNLLDDIGMAWVDHELKRYVKLAAGVVIIATANISHGSNQHAGTFVIDDAMADRFSYHLTTDYLSPSYEAQVLIQRTGVPTQVAERLVQVANKIREISSDPDSDSPIDKAVSFRQLLKASEAIAHGMNPVQAATFTIFSKFDTEGGDESAQAKVREIFQGKFGN